MIRFPNTPKLFEALASRFGGHPETIVRYFADYNGVLQRELDKRTPDDTTRHSIYLTSPDGSSWEVTVGDTGTITTTKVAG